MFELDFGKLALIAVVALLVLGPERLPGAARTLGALVRRARASWQSVRTEIERELAAEDLKRSIHDVTKSADIFADVQAATHTVRTAVLAEPASLGTPKVEPGKTAPNKADSGKSSDE